ncbi:MAG TPA: beta-eliminating lyase-related protein [Rhizomicrobium sp.]|nr:beta-eliminating lyase-related protein [Rhizomicrobium sp.]
MNFVSDNAYGASPEILAAMTAAAADTALSYGEDALTARLTGRLSEIFEREVAVFPVVTGTAANALSLSVLCPPFGAVVCHSKSHIAADECGAPEFFTGGARLALVEAPGGKLAPEHVDAALTRFASGVHSMKPSAVSIAQATEMGTVYRPAEVAALAARARAHGLKLHMDGARFANALARLGCTPAEASWRAGVDALSFGATKNGAAMAEAAIFFDPAAAADFGRRRKRAGHLVSKMRFISAQLLAYLENGLWLANAARANACAARLAEGLARLPGIALAHPVEANAVFAWMPAATAGALRRAGARFYDWETARDGRVMARLVCSFATPDADVARLLEAVRSAPPA